MPVGGAITPTTGPKSRYFLLMLQAPTPSRCQVKPHFLLVQRSLAFPVGEPQLPIFETQSGLLVLDFEVPLAAARWMCGRVGFSSGTP